MVSVRKVVKEVANKVVMEGVTTLVMALALVVVPKMPMRDVKLFKKEQLWKQRCYLNI